MDEPDQNPSEDYDDSEYETPKNDSGSFGWAVLGFLLPLIGIILFIAWHNSKPNNAKSAGAGALVRIIVRIILCLIAFLVLGIGDDLIGTATGVMM